jgi:hypothetical protein
VGGRRERRDEVAEVPVDEGVPVDPFDEGVELGAAGEVTVDEQIGDLEER